MTGVPEYSRYPQSGVLQNRVPVPAYSDTPPIPPEKPLPDRDPPENPDGDSPWAFTWKEALTATGRLFVITGIIFTCAMNNKKDIENAGKKHKNIPAPHKIVYKNVQPT